MPDHAELVAEPAEDARCTPRTSEPLSAAEAEEMAVLFKAIADPVRLRLVSLIACHEGGKACVCDLTGAFDVTPPTISHHLKVLREAGLIGSQRRGTWVDYWINPAVLGRLSMLIEAQVTATAGSDRPVQPLQPEVARRRRR